MPAASVVVSKVVSKNPMKIIVAGSRGITDREYIKKQMAKMIENKYELVCGMAAGVDVVARDIAMECGLTVHEFPADWNTLGKKAGYLRNVQMAEFAEGLLAIWDGESRGHKAHDKYSRITWPEGKSR